MSDFRKLLTILLTLASPFLLTAWIVGFHCNQPEPEKPATFNDVLRGCKG